MGTMEGRVNKGVDEGLPLTVDVVMLAYNVGPCMVAAIEGVIAQQAPFPIRLVIAEDCSTDDTQAICARYAASHPAIVDYVPGEVNLGIPGRLNAAMARCSAKYVAFCDGDDIWTDPHKLADQVAHLEAHPEVGLSYTDIAIIDKEGRPVPPPDGHESIRAEHDEGDIFVKLLQVNFIPNSATVVRASMLEGHTVEPTRDYNMTDLLMWFHVLSGSTAHYLPRRTICYRRGGVTTGDAVSRRNQRKMKGVIGGILLRKLRFGPLHERDRPVMTRKVLGVLRRGGTPLRIKLALIALAGRYLPSGFVGWCVALRYRAPAPISVTLQHASA